MTLADLSKYSLCYLATPYTKYKGGLVVAFEDAARLSARLLKRGVKVYSPIVHGHAIAIHGDINPMDLTVWLPHNALFLQLSNILLVAKMDGWEFSEGIAHEIKTSGKPIVYLDPEHLTISLTA